MYNINMDKLGKNLLASVSISIGNNIYKQGWWCCSCNCFYENKPKICTKIVWSEINFEKLLSIYNEYLKKSNKKNNYT